MRLIRRSAAHKAHLPKIGAVGDELGVSQDARCGYAVIPFEDLQIISDVEVALGQLCRRCFDVGDNELEELLR